MISRRSQEHRKLQAPFFRCRVRVPGIPQLGCECATLILSHARLLWRRWYANAYHSAWQSQPRVTGPPPDRHRVSRCHLLLSSAAFVPPSRRIGQRVLVTHWPWLLLNRYPSTQPFVFCPLPLCGLLRILPPSP